MPSKASWAVWNPGARGRRKDAAFHWVMPNMYGEGWYCPTCRKTMARRSEWHGLGPARSVQKRKPSKAREPFDWRLMKEIEQQDAHLASI